MMINEYLAPLKKWWWLLAVAVLIAGLTAFLVTRPLPDVYLAKTTLVIGNAISSLNPTNDELVMAQQLAITYSDQANRDRVREATKKALGLNDLPPYKARTLPNGPFMEISVTYGDPKVAQAVANELANQLILISPASLEQSAQDSLTFVEQQLKDIELRIKKTNEEIQKKQEDLSTMTSAVEINQAQSEMDALDTRLARLQQTYAGIQAGMPQGARNQLRVYESAELPRIPVGPNRLLIILLASVAGLLIGALAAYVIEAVDNTVKTQEEFTRLLDMPIIGRISNLPGGKNSWTFALDMPNAPPTEDFRLLRTNLDFFGVDQPLHLYMITSPDIGDGKSTVAANLAMLIGQSERRVILVDADLRRPKIAEGLGINDEGKGLTDVLSHSTPLESALIPWPGSPNLRILPAGTPPPNPTELLGSHRMEAVMENLRTLAEVIILDGPPFIVADASVLASKVDGVVLVVRPGHSHRAAVAAMKDQLKRVNLRVLGMVINQAPARTSYYAARYTPQKSKKKKNQPGDQAAQPGD